MTRNSDDLWRKRFHVMMLARLFGIAVFLLGIAIAYSDLLRPGGWRLLGGLLAIMGGLDAVFAPRMLKTLWNQEDSRGDQG